MSLGVDGGENIPYWAKGLIVPLVFGRSSGNFVDLGPVWIANMNFAGTDADDRS